MRDLQENKLPVSWVWAALKPLRLRLYGQWIEQTQNQVSVGLAELNQGERLDGEAVIAQLQKKFRQAREIQE